MNKNDAWPGRIFCQGLGWEITVICIQYDNFVTGRQQLVLSCIN